MSNAAALSAKEKGNAAFKAGDYPTAIGHYTAAILADKNDPTYALNRAAAYLKLGKHGDAERDCTKVLELSAKNVKALFRRAQAREGLGKLEESVNDLRDALRLEPGNKSVQDELSKLEGLAKVQKASKKPQQVTPTPPHPKRRRVPITIVEPQSSQVSSSPSTVSASTPDPIPERLSADIGMQAVSSRSLQTETKSPSPSSPQPSPSTPPSPTTRAQTQSKPSTFTEAKELRDNTKPPSYVGGGIFRASGRHTVFPTRDGSELPRPSSDSATPNVKSPKTNGAQAASQQPAQTSMSLFEFNRKWDSCSSSDERWSLLSSIPASSIPVMFQTSLEAGLLASMLTAILLQVKLHPNDAPMIREIMDQISIVPRFATLVLFLSRAEKEVAREIWRSLGDEDVGPWRVII